MAVGPAGGRSWPHRDQDEYASLVPPGPRPLPMTRIPTLLLCCLVGTSAVAAQRPQHSVALVNDPRSHGQVGDALLSLNEAILLHNRQLTYAQLSPAEQGQINGSTDVAWADLDSTVIPTVTLERDLDPVTNLPHGLVIGATNGRVTILIGNTRGFTVDSDFCDFRNLIIQGGSTAVTLTQRDTFYGSIFENVLFVGQTVRAVHASLIQDDGETLIGIENCTFRGLPMGIQIDDIGRGRRGQMWMSGCAFEGGTDGYLLNLGPGVNGYTLTYQRSRFEGHTGTALELRRADANATRGVVVEITDLRTRGASRGVVIDGHASALTDVTLRMAECGGTTEGLRVGGAGTNTKVTVLESRLLGPADLRGSTGVTIDNSVIGSSLRTATAGGAPHAVTGSVLLGATVAPQGTTGLGVGGCRLVGGSVTGTATAPVTLQACHLESVTLGANATANGSLPTAQLGVTDLAPTEVGIGQTITLYHALPSGFTGVWLFGLAADRATVVEGLRVYINPTTWLIYAGAWRDTGQVPFPVPPISALRQLDLMFQMVVGHDVGVAGPRLAMPPGRRVMIR